MVCKKYISSKKKQDFVKLLNDENTMFEITKKLRQRSIEKNAT